MDRHYPPSRWDEVSLGALEDEGHLLMRNGFPCGDNNEQGIGVPQLRPMNVDEFCDIDLSHVKYIETRRELADYWLQTDDVVFNNTNSRRLVGKTAVWSSKSKGYVISNHMTLLRLRDKETLDSHFLSFFIYFLWHSGYFEQKRQQHVNQASISLKGLRATIIPLPPLTEQRSIVRVLKGVQTAKKDRQHELELERERKAALMHHLFTFGTNEEPTKQTDVGLMPINWETHRLGDVCQLFQGLCINAKTKHLLVEQSSLPLLRIKDLRENSAERFVSENGWPENALVTESDIIYTRTGQIGLVFRGRVGILHNNCFKVKPTPVLDNDYLFWWLQYPAFRARIINLTSNSAQADITHSLFKAQPILVPPLEEQRNIASVLFACDTKIATVTQEITVLEELFWSLLNKLMNGSLSAVPLIGKVTS
jgi:type I restriction enzyme S subunit